MKAKAIIARTVVLSMVLLSGILFFSRPLQQRITVQPIGSVQSGNVTTMTFAITNHTSNRYFVVPRMVEFNDGVKWRMCFEFKEYNESELKPFGYKSLPLTITNLPSSPHQRLKLTVVKELKGIKGFPGRLRLKFVDGFSDVSLNPFNKYEAMGSHEISIVSDEFVEPQSN